jgi:hypothetical protein
MRRPSEKLAQQLSVCGLCAPEDLAACEPLVRQLCKDLPDFDSVWLDALVRQRVLTPWQAERLLSGDGTELVVDSLQFQRPLGRFTFLAMAADSSRGELFAVRRLSSATPDEASARLTAMLESVASAARSKPATLVLPERLVRTANRETVDPRPQSEQDAGAVHVVSKYVAGWSLEELLIRGGRLPWQVVAEIGSQLLPALAWLEGHQLRHGDLTLNNVRLDCSGHAWLVNALVRPLEQPRIVLNDRLTLRDVDGVAPEQFGTSRVPDARSELHALGCLLWQLLTSRPVVLNADPVARLMKLAEHDVPDVRGLVPDCPDWLARQLLAMTRRSPELRPSSAADVLKSWNPSFAAGTSHSRRLARQMPDHRQQPVVVARRSKARRARRWAWPASAAGVLLVLVLLLARSGLVPHALRMAPWSGPATPEADTRPGASEAGSPTADVLPLPPPDASGVITLKSQQRYAASSLRSTGRLIVQSSGGPPAIIEVASGLDVRWIAATVELRNLRIERPSADAAIPSPRGTRVPQLLAIQSAALSVSGCVIQAPADADDFAGLAWDRLRETEGVVLVTDSVFAGGGYAMSLSGRPRRCEWNNVLLASRGGGVLCAFRTGDSLDWAIDCDHVTQRFGFSVVDVIVPDDATGRLRLVMTSTDCVFAPQMAVTRIRSPQSWTPEAMQVLFRAREAGYPAIVPPGTQPVAWIDPALNQPVSLPDRQVPEQSLLLAELTFRDPATTPAAAPTPWDSSALEDFDGPKFTTSMPGIDTARLPVE